MNIRIANRIVTGLFTALILMGVGMYLTQHEMVAEMYGALGFPTWLIYPLATAKVLGLIAIWSRKSAFLENLAYAGFFYKLVLAVLAHVMVGDGQFAGALVALILVSASYETRRRVDAASVGVAAA